MFKSKKPLYVGAAMLAVVALFGCVFLPLHRQIRQKRELQEAVALEVRRGMEPYTQTEEYSTETIVLTQEDVELLAKAVYPLIDTQVTMDTSGATRQWTEEKLEHLEDEIADGVAQVISGNLVYDRENQQQTVYAEKLQNAITRNITMIVEEVLLQHLPQQEEASLEGIMFRDALDLNRMELEQSREESMKKIRKLQEDIGLLQTNLTSMTSEAAPLSQVEEMTTKLGYLSEQYTDLVNEYALQKNVSFSNDLEQKEATQKLDEQAKETAKRAQANKEEILKTGKRLEEVLVLLEGSLGDYQNETAENLGNLEEDLKLTKESLARTNAFGETMKLDMTLQKEELDQKLADLKQATDENLISLQRETDQNLSELQQVMNEKFTGLQQTTEEQITGLQQTTDRSLNELQQMTDQNLQNLQQEVQLNYLSALQLQESYYNKTEADEKYLTREEAAASTYTKGEIDSMLAPGYDPQTVYETGSVIVKDGVMYECIVSPEGPEEWNPEHWQPITMMDLLSSGAGSDSYREMILVALSSSGMGLTEDSDWEAITTALQNWFPAKYDLLGDGNWIQTASTRGCFGPSYTAPAANRHSLESYLSGNGDNRPYIVTGYKRTICDRKMGFGGFKTLRMKGYFQVNDNNLDHPEFFRVQIYERADLSSPVLATLATYTLNGKNPTNRGVSFDTY
nr:hypothetical protein [Lachnospiraceae bacterium]